ncbi:putative quinone oxidoreductase [Sclerotinia borealis F-4128]|uniref:Putative quinone oxidoreductase n=1 Tax=Sclerotinia borealis (strain F-4128) TaxID=1432307 RepID=W9C849_SCLBF|nr:putative quinone oxidoreductase [Sclerotinia borealis F-4128]
MKEVIVHPSPDIWTEIVEAAIPQPGPDEVVIKVIVAGSNVKDWLHLKALNKSLNSGDDIAGIIHSLGKNVCSKNEFHLEDRVAAFHPMLEPHGAYAEFAVAPMHTIMKLPDAMTFEEAATIPLVATTAAISLYRRQHLPPPWSPRSDSIPIPLIIYGASSSLGTFAIKLARASNIHPIIAIAGGSSSHLETLLDPSSGDKLIDYRLGTEKMIKATKIALGNLECHHALDAISSNGTWIPISHMLAPSFSSQSPSYLSVVAGSNKYDEESIQAGIEIVYTMVGTAHMGAYKPGMVKQPTDKEFVRGDPRWVSVFFKYMSQMLADGRLTGHPFEIIDEGLNGVEEGLRRLQGGQARGVKYVYKVGQVE